MTNEERSKAIRLKPGESRANEATSGLSGYCVHTQAEVARMLGISRQAVNQAERMAILKLREGLKEYWESFHVEQ